MRLDRSRVSGMSLLEVLVSATLLAVGIVATLLCLGSISTAQGRALDSETMERLAIAKFNDLIVRQTLTVGQADGDFSDLGEKRFVWHADRQSVGQGNLDVLHVEVAPVGDNFVHAEKVQGLIATSNSSGGGS